MGWLKALAAAHLACLAAFAEPNGLNLFLLISGACLLLALLILPSVRTAPPFVLPLAEPDMQPEPPRAARPRAEPTELDAATWAELMARMSHELRTPLNAIIGFSDLMGGELFGPVGHPRYREYVDHIRDSGRDLLRSAEDTLAITSLLARPKTGHGRQSTSLDAVAGEAWQAHAAQAAYRGVQLAASGLADVEVLADRRALRQIVGNLLAESLARARTGSVIGISAAVQGATVKLTIQASGDRASHHARASSLPACLARIMLELNGSTLVETLEPDGTWQAHTWLDAATQDELFQRLEPQC